MFSQIDLTENINLMLLLKVIGENYIYLSNFSGVIGWWYFFLFCLVLRLRKLAKKSFYFIKST